MAKDEEYNRLIHSAKWSRLRYKKLSINPLCEICESEGRIRAATEVHHVVPIETEVSYTGKRTLAYSINNLQSLCHDCHIAVHTSMGRSGKDATKRLNDKRIKIINKMLYEE